MIYKNNNLVSMFYTLNEITTKTKLQEILNILNLNNVLSNSFLNGLIIEKLITVFY